MILRILRNGPMIIREFCGRVQTRDQIESEPVCKGVVEELISLPLLKLEQGKVWPFAVCIRSLAGRINADAPWHASIDPSAQLAKRSSTREGDFLYYPLRCPLCNFWNARTTRGLELEKVRIDDTSPEQLSQAFVPKFPSLDTGQRSHCSADGVLDFMHELITSLKHQTQSQVFSAAEPGGKVGGFLDHITPLS